MKPLCLTIAGADPTSGAGIQADIRTFDRCGVHPFSVITAITYQTATEFIGYKSLSDELDNQLNAILTAYPIEYVKIGMIPDSKSINIIIDYIKKYNLNVILDPIFVSSAGGRLSSKGVEFEIEKLLFPYVKIITPNISEAEFYSDKYINNQIDENLENLKEVAEILINKLYRKKESQDLEKAVVIKSAGSNNEELFDLVLLTKKKNGQLKKEFQLFKKKKVFIEGNIHGSGCVFSSAITAFLAMGYTIEEAIGKAEEFFNERFQTFIEFPDKGKVIDLTISEEKQAVVEQIKEIYNFISQSKDFSKLIPEVRMNISGSLPNATKNDEIAGIEGRITIINGYPRASGEIKFGVSDHTARLILSSKKFDNSINFVMNLKYIPELIKTLQEKKDLDIVEIVREKQPNEIKAKEFSTMEWLIKETAEKKGKVPDLIFDKGSVGKEPMIRLFGRNSKEIIDKLKKIHVFLST
ncbi:MAG: bifunctional hydroxymethylpyrimidine kinase/phosphomethylpyrimidine kinase [Promethearchaeota archaeon]